MDKATIDTYNREAEKYCGLAFNLNTTANL